MPRKYRKVTKKRTYKKRRTVPRKRIRSAPGPFRNISSDPFGASKFCKLHWSQTITLGTPVAGGYTFGPERIFRLNSLYDPDWGIGGHQPYGYDELSALYRKYKVSSVKINVVYTDPTADGMCIGATIQPPQGVAQIEGHLVGTVKERPMSVTRSINNSGTQAGSFTQYQKIQTVSGLTPIQFKADIDTFTGLTGGTGTGDNPAASPFLRLAVANNRSIASTMLVRVTFTFYCQFYERIVLPVS